MSDLTPRRQVRSFVLRAGRMTQGQHNAYQQHWPQFGLDPSKVLVPSEEFTAQQSLVLEIGFGMGESLAEMAGNEPEHNFIGVEVHRAGVGKLLQRMQQQQLDNIRIYEHDAVEVIQHCIADNSLERVQIYFPDPWHKKKHHKRRLIQPAFVDLLSCSLKPGGILHIATDWQNYAEHILGVVEQAAQLRNLGEPFSSRPQWRPETKFEARGKRLGHAVWELLYVKREPNEAT